MESEKKIKKNHLRLVCVLGRYVAQAHTTMQWNEMILDLKELDTEEVKEYVMEVLDAIFMEFERTSYFQNHIKPELQMLGTPDLREIADDVLNSFIYGFQGEWIKKLHKQKIYPWGTNYNPLKDCKL
ncbi:MAG: hypothetical protein ACOC44_17360 [Promethearchaeia archaeon]